MPATLRWGGSKKIWRSGRAGFCAGRVRGALKFASGGIEVETDAAEGAAEFAATSVVIADGGFQAELRHDPRAHFAGARKTSRAQRRHRDRRWPAHGAGGRRREHRPRHVLRPSAQPRCDEFRPAVAAALCRRDRGRGHRHRRRRPPLRRRGMGGIDCPTSWPACPIRSAPRIIFDQPIWDGPPGRGHAQPPNPLLPRRAARCIAPARLRSWPD